MMRIMLQPFVFIFLFLSYLYPCLKAEECNFHDLVIPDNTRIYAGGAYSGRKIGIQIDDSGDEATLMEVVVNSPKNPVILILGNYAPTIWHFKWTSGTRIVAVAIGGYQTQIAIGLPANVPAITGSYKEGKCWNFYYNETSGIAKINRISTELFNREPDMEVWPLKQGMLVIGNDTYDTRNLITAREFDRREYIRDDRPPAGKDGIRDALNRNLIRVASPKVIKEWEDKHEERFKSGNSARNRSTSGFTRHGLSSYEVISNQFIIPAGLFGANSVDFFIPENIDIPKGEIGHCTLYLLKDGSCLGVNPGCTLYR